MEGLTKIDISALKKADIIRFHYDSENGSYIIASKDLTSKERNQNPFISKYEYHINIGDDKEIMKIKGYCFFYNNECWKTITEFLKPGDIFSLLWDEDAHSSELLREFKLHGDVLYLRVIRTSKNGETKFFRFFIDSAISFNDSARMIKAA